MKFLSKSLFIFGCGYLGKQLASYFIKRNYRVGALTRNKKMANELINLGLKEVVIANLEDSSWHNKIRCNYNHVINCVGSGNGRVTNNAEVKDIQDRIAGYENSYFKGQQSIFKWLSNKKIKTFIYTSSTSVYSNNSFPEKLLEVDSDNMVLNCVENISLNNIRYLNPGVRILIETEELIRNKDNKFIYDNYFIYRLSGIYGPNRLYAPNLISLRNQC